MKKIAVLAFLLVLPGIAGSIFAGGKKEDGQSKPQKVEVSGRVRMVGNSPMTSIVLSGEEREWYIAPEEEYKLKEFQQQMVTVKAKEYYYDRIFANGASAGRQYFLKDIVIKKIQ